MDTLEAYTDAMAGLIVGPVPDADYELRSLAVDEGRGTVCGPVPPTGKRVETDFVYVMEFEGDRIRHITKIWNEVWAMRQLGWSA